MRVGGGGNEGCRMIKAVMIVQTEINHSASDGENLLQQITVGIALIELDRISQHSYLHLMYNTFPSASYPWQQAPLHPHLCVVL